MISLPDGAPWWTALLVAGSILVVGYLEHGTPAALIEAEECAELCHDQDARVRRWSPHECWCGP